MTIAVEGATDIPVIRRLLAEAGHALAVAYGGHGKGPLDSNLVGYNNAARFAPWFVLRDLDHDGECAPALASGLLPAPAEHMRLRIAVRETESWLLGDAESLAAFLSVKSSRIPTNPDRLDDPKQALVNLARQSRRREIRDDMVPALGTSAVVGPAYGSRIEEFAREHWRPSVAATRSSSLKRTLDRLNDSWAGIP